MGERVGDFDNPRFRWVSLEQCITVMIGPKFLWSKHASLVLSSTKDRVDSLQTTCNLLHPEFLLKWVPSVLSTVTVGYCGMYLYVAFKSGAMAPFVAVCLVALAGELGNPISTELISEMEFRSKTKSKICGAFTKGQCHCELILTPHILEMPRRHGEQC